MALQKAKLALAIATVSSSLAMTGCLVDGNKSNDTSTSSTVQQDASRISVTDQATPRAEILGIVQDTNGNPVAGARVSIGSITATTDANGAYALANVAVTGFTAGDEGQAATPIQVSIVPANPADGTKYLAATVAVTPKASTVIKTANGTSANTEDALLAIITTDGLAVSAGVTVVPALGSTVKGILRDNTTGLTLANAVIGFEMVGVKGIAQQQTQNNAGAGTSYGVGKFQVATDASGAFEIANLPEDTDFTISVENWNYHGLAGGNTGATSIGGARFATTAEVVKQNIGTITVDPIVSNDNIEPFVTSVNGVISNVDPALLNDDLNGTQGFVVNFSEPMQAIVDANSVYAYNETKKERIAVTSATLAADARSVNVVTAAIPAGDVFSLYLNAVDFQDVAGNTIESKAGTTPFLGKNTPAYDLASDVNSLSAVRLHMKAYADPLATAGAVVGLAQVLKDTAESKFKVLQAVNATFNDVDAESLLNNDNSIEQLNSGETTTGTRLKDLATSTYGDSGLAGAPAAVETDRARVSFTLDATTPSRKYEVTLKSATGATKNVSAIIDTATVGTLTNNGTNKVTLTAKDDFSGSVAMLLDGIAVNDVLTISSVTDFGTTDQTATVTLMDKVGPTTVLQSSYGQGLKTSGTNNGNYGNGGELSDATANAIGAPFLNITPRLFVPQAGNNVALPVSTIWDSLIDANAKDPTTLQPRVNVTIGANKAAYDKAAFAAWTPGARTIGIAFSKNVALTGTPAYNGTVGTLSGWAAKNDVLRNDLGTPVMADLVNVNVANIFTLGNTDNAKVIDFTNVVTDTETNAALPVNNAKVVVRDLLPPFITDATYNGEEIVITFNENVTLEAGNDFVLRGTAATKTINAVADANNTTVSNNVVTIKRANFGDIDSEVLFNRGTYDHDGLNTTPDAAHGIIQALQTEDANGISWDNWSTGPDLFAHPGLVIRDDAGAFSVGAPTLAGFTATSTSFTATYIFSHRIDLVNSGLAANATTMTPAEVNAAFTLTGATIDIAAGTTTGATLSANGRELTVTVKTTALTTGNTFGATGRAIRSVWDANDAVISTIANVTVP